MAVRLQHGDWTVSETHGFSIEDMYASRAPPASIVPALAHSPRKGLSAASLGVTDPSRPCLTPRSAEACLMAGVDPRDLHSRDLNTFVWGGADRAVAQMRSDTYNRMREEKMDALRIARDALSRGTLPASLGVPSTARVVMLASDSIVGPPDGPASLAQSSRLGASVRAAQDTLFAETERLAKIQKRQQRELAQLIASELRLADARTSLAQKDEMEARRFAERDEELVAKRNAEAQVAAMRAAKKKLADAAEDERRKEMLAAATRKEAAARAEASRKLEQAKREGVEKELLRQQKALAIKREARVKERERQAAILARMTELEQADADRQARAEDAARERARDAELRRVAAEARQQANRVAAARLEAERIAEQERRERRAEENRIARENARLAELAAAEQEAILTAQRAAKKQELAARDEETRKALLEARMAAEAEALERIKAEELREAALKRERNHLEEAAKLDAVERAKRRDEYRRMVVLRTIEDKIERGKLQTATKAEAARLRREMAGKAALQRHAVITAMESFKGKRDYEKVQNELAGLMQSGVASAVESATRGGGGVAGGASRSSTLPLLQGGHALLSATSSYGPVEDTVQHQPSWVGGGGNNTAGGQGGQLVSLSSVLHGGGGPSDVSGAGASGSLGQGGALLWGAGGGGGGGGSGYVSAAISQLSEGQGRAGGSGTYFGGSAGYGPAMMALHARMAAVEGAAQAGQQPQPSAFLSYSQPQRVA